VVQASTSCRKVGVRPWNSMSRSSSSLLRSCSPWCWFQVAFGPILKTLDDRHSKIEGAREEAARLSGTSGSNAGLIEKKLSEARTAGQEEMAASRRK